MQKKGGDQRMKQSKGALLQAGQSTVHFLELESPLYALPKIGGTSVFSLLSGVSMNIFHLPGTPLIYNLHPS